LILDDIDKSWQETIAYAMKALPADYVDFLDKDSNYIPNKANFLNAFKTLPKNRVKYILFGQDPYPRAQSATGYAFIDGAVEHIFSHNGLSKSVNRATSLRNFIKMALVADGRLDCSNTSQSAIAALCKSDLIDSIDELRSNFERSGVLLLNTALIFTSKEQSKSNIKMWQGFIQRLLESMIDIDPNLILFGTYAKELKKIAVVSKMDTIDLEHPYNHTFICNQKAQDLFKDMQLLRASIV